MKFLLLLIGCSLSALTFAQTAPRSVRIQISYEKAGQHLEQAVETIEAINTIGAKSVVAYQAGHSISLLPGFQAKGGSVFTADIRPIVNASSEVSLQLKAYPNPFEESTTIEYYLPADGKVNLWVTDAQGKVVGELVKDEKQTAGVHKAQWQPHGISTGVYVPTIEANEQKAVSRLIKK